MQKKRFEMGKYSAILNSCLVNYILGLQPRDKAAMLGVKTKEHFLEEFT